MFPAAVGRARVHFAEPGDKTVDGAQDRLDVPVPAINAICVTALVAFTEAVINALATVEIVPAVVVKLLCVCPAATTTAGGTESTDVFEDSATVTGDALLAAKLTRQVVLWLLERLDTVQLTPET